MSKGWDDGMYSFVLGFRVVLIATSNGWKIQNLIKIDVLRHLRDYYIRKCLKFSKRFFVVVVVVVVQRT